MRGWRPMVSRLTHRSRWSAPIPSPRAMRRARRCSRAPTARPQSSRATTIWPPGVLNAAHEAGIAVPDALSVVGFDDSNIALVVWPRLTTIHQPIRDMAREATGALLALIEDKRGDQAPSAAPANALRTGRPRLDGADRGGAVRERASARRRDRARRHQMRLHSRRRPRPDRRRGTGADDHARGDAGGHRTHSRRLARCARLRRARHRLLRPARTARRRAGLTASSPPRPSPAGRIPTSCHDCSAATDCRPRSIPTSWARPSPRRAGATRKGCRPSPTSRSAPASARASSSTARR